MSQSDYPDLDRIAGSSTKSGYPDLMDIENDSSQSRYPNLDAIASDAEPVPIQGSPILGDDAHNAITLSAGKNPDEEAKKLRLSQKLSMPQHLIDVDPIAAEIAAKEADIRAAATKSPALQKFYADPKNVSISNDDVDTLVGIEDVFNILKRRTGMTMSALASGGVSLASGLAGVPRYYGEQVDLPGSEAIADYAGRSQDYLSNLSEDLMPKADTALGQAGYSGVASIGSNLPLAPLGVVAGAKASLAVMGASVFGNQYKKGMDEGLNGAESMIYAILHGAAEAAGEALPLNKLIGDLKEGAPFIKMLAQQMALEVPGEQLTTVAQDAVDWAYLNPEKTMDQFLDERGDAALETLVATVIGTGGQTSILKAGEAGIRKADELMFGAARAEAAAAQVERLNKLAAASKTIERDPASAEQFIEAAIGDGAMDVYIEAKAIADSEFYQEIVAASPSVAEQIDAALQTGGEVRISSIEYMTKIAPKEFAQSIVDDVRIDGEEFTRRQAREIMSKQKQIEIRSEIEAALKRARSDESFSQELDNLAKTIVENGNWGNKFSDDQRKAQAMQMAAYTLATAKRLNRPVEEIFATLPGIRSEDVMPGGDVLQEPNARYEKTRPLTRAQFNRSYMRHIDIRGRESGDAEDRYRSILENGWKGVGANLMGVVGGSTVLDKAYSVRKGDSVYLVPKGQYTEDNRAPSILDTYKPMPFERIIAKSDDQDMYEAYLEEFDKYSKAEEKNSVEERKRKIDKAQADMFLDANAPAEAASKEARDNLFVRYESVANQETSVGIDKVLTDEDAAHVFAGFRKHAQETVHALVTDDDGNILEMIRHTKGGVDQAAFYPGLLAASVISVPGAKKVWVSHNHPSGNLEQSKADIQITEMFENILQDSGVEFMGHSIVAPGTKTSRIIGPGGASWLTDILPGRRNKKQPITERVLRKRDKSSMVRINNSSDSEGYAASIKSDFALILLNTQNQVVGVLNMTDAEMSALRDNKQVSRIHSAIAATNAVSAIIKSPEQKYGGADKAKNLARFLNGYTDISLLDYVYNRDGKKWESASSYGYRIGDETGDYYQIDNKDAVLEEINFLESFGIYTKEEAAKLRLEATAEYDEHGYRKTSDADRRAFLQRVAPLALAREDRRAGMGDGDTAGLPDGQSEARVYSERSQLLRKILERSHAITAEVNGPGRDETSQRTVAEGSLGPFTGYTVGARHEKDRLFIEYYGTEQIAAGLTAEPALQVILNKTGEVVFQGPKADSETFAEFKKRGWADMAKTADGVSQFFTALTSGKEALETGYLIDVLADAHARMREWRKEDKVGLVGERHTGAAGRAQHGKMMAIFGQSGNPRRKKKTSAPDGTPTHDLNGDPLNEALMPDDDLTQMAGPDQKALTRLFQRRAISEFNDVETEAFNKYLDSRKDGKQIRERLQKHEGSAWAVQAIEAIFVRQAIEEYSVNKTPEFESFLDHVRCKKARDSLRQFGKRGALLYVRGNNFIGAAEKPGHNISSSFLNCDPSENCAKYCYATKANYRYANTVLKSELIDTAVQLYPEEVADAIYAEWTQKLDYIERKALRLFDKGDGNDDWLPVIKSLNSRKDRDGRRVIMQIFSKRPEFLRQVPSMNVRMLSIDVSNLHMINDNLDLPVAFVYTGTEAEDAALVDLLKRGKLSVVLPVHEGKKVMTREERQELIERVPGVKRYLCPIDGGIKKLPSTIQKEGKKKAKKAATPQEAAAIIEQYNPVNGHTCTSCDKGGGIGCFTGKVSAQVMASLEVTGEQLSPQQMIAEFNKLELELTEALYGSNAENARRGEGVDGSDGARADLGSIRLVDAGRVEDIRRRHRELMAKLLAQFKPDQETAVHLLDSGRYIDTGVQDEGNADGSGELYQSKQWYSSTITRAISGLKQDKGTPEQMIAMLKNAGAKEKEMDAIGLPEALRIVAKGGTVSKADIEAIVANSGIKIVDVMYGDQDTSSIDLPDGWRVMTNSENLSGITERIRQWLENNGLPQVSLDEIPDDILNDELALERDALMEEWDEEASRGSFLLIDEDGEIVGEGETPGDAIVSAQDADEREFVRSPKYKKYSLPGPRHNDRELLLTLPVSGAGDNTSSEFSGTIKFFKPDDVEDFLVDIQDIEGMEDLDYGRDDDSPLEVKFSGFSKSQYEDFVGRSRSLAGLVTANEKSASPVYKSSHWEEKNVAVHIRFNDRYDTDGNRVLFIEEIQSDWAQEGRKRGFIPKNPPRKVSEVLADIRSEAASIFQKRLEALNIDKEVYDAHISTVQNDQGAWFRILRSEPEGSRGHELIREYYEAYKGDGGSIPRAPFVENTQDWTSLAIKRAIAYAVENEFDKVAFVNGEQSAERYRLQKVVDKLSWVQQKDSTYLIVGEKDGFVQFEKSRIEKDGLSDFVGKELAEKIISSGDIGSIEGDGLKVGGKGMIAFYDDIIPKVAGKVISKMGGKLSTTRIDTDELEYSHQVSFDITDGMRAAVGEGLPVFQKKRGAYSPSKNLITLLQNADLSTFLHESGHFYLESHINIVKSLVGEAEFFGYENLSKEESQIINDVSSLMKWFGIQGDIVEQLGVWEGLDIEEMRAYHEQFAESYEAYLFEGKSPSIELTSLFKQFTSFLKSVYVSLKKFLDKNPGAQKLNDEVREIFDRMLATDEQIEIAKHARGMSDIFEMVDQAGMADDEWRAIQQVSDKLTEDEKEKLAQRSIRDMKYASNAKNKKLKEMQKEADALRREIRMEVRPAVMSQPVYQAWQFLTGKLTKDEKRAVKPRNPAKSVPGDIDESIDSLFVAIAKLGGLNREQVEREWGWDRKAKSPMPVFGSYLIRPGDGGKEIDMIAEGLAERGYLPLDEHGKWDLHDLEDRFFAELGGNKMYSVAADYDLINGEEFAGEGALNPNINEGLGVKSGRIDIPSLREMGYSDVETIKRLEQMGMAADQGIHPDLIAQIVGYQSGDQMIREILDAEPPKTVIAREVDRIMAERHAELATPEAMAEAADRAIHNEVRGRHIATEANAIAKLAGKPAIMREAAKRAADDMVMRLTIGELKSRSHALMLAESRAGKAKLEASKKGDWAEAAIQARNQVINYETRTAILDADEQSKKLLREWKDLANRSDEKLKKGYDMDIINAFRAILGEFGIAEKKAKKAAEYLERVKEYDPDMYSVLADSINRMQAFAKPVKELTVEDFAALAIEMDSVTFLARRVKQATREAGMIDIKAAEDELINAINQSKRDDITWGSKHAITPEEMRAQQIMAVGSFLSRVENWCERMDLGILGPFKRNIFQPIKDAADRYRADRARYLQKFQDLLEPIKADLKPMKIYSHELGYTFGMDEGSSAINEILHAILHTGNEGNKKKLLVGRGWADVDSDGNINTAKWDLFINRMVKEGKLRKEHFDFAQGVWDLLEETKPLAQKTHRAVFGKYFDEVTADGFVDPFGESRRGGYVPAQVDTRIVKDNALRQLAEQQNESMAYSFPTTAKGFTKARVEYNRPLLLDIRSLTQHIDKVLKFSHMEEVGRDVNRLLSGDAGKRLTQVDPTVIDGMLMPWLQRSVNQTVDVPIAGDYKMMRFFAGMRSFAGMSTMMANLINTMQQITGFSMAAIKVKPSLMRQALVMYIKNPKAFSEAVTSMSSYMDNRMENEVATINGRIRNILVNPSVYESARNWTAEHAYFMQSGFDNVMSPIIWTAAYNQYIRDNSHEDAIKLADGVIRMTQGSQLPEDISRMESGNAFFRLFTQFASYFNMQANLLGTEINTLVREIGLRKGAGRALYVYAMGFAIPAIVSEAIRQVMIGGPEDEDDDGWLDEWLMQVFGISQVRTATAMIPYGGQIINLAVAMANDKPYDDRMSMSPAISLIEGTVRAPFSVYNAIVDDASAQKAVRDVGTLVGAMGLAGGAYARPFGYMAGVQSGEIDPEGPVDLIRGVLTGVASPESKQ